MYERVRNDSLNNQHRRHSAFTLAEILITLLIVGVIASLVIPNIIGDTKENEYNVRAKKAYADLSQAVLTGLGGSSTGGSAASFRDDFCNIMTCVQKGTGSEIFGSISYKSYKGGVVSGSSYGPTNSGIQDSAVMQNGSLIQLGSYTSCGDNGNVGLNICGYIVDDTNGKQEPNMWGRDLYMFAVVKNTNGYTVVPIGSPNDNIGNTNKGGEGCKAGTGKYGCTYVRVITPNDMP